MPTVVDNAVITGGVRSDPVRSVGCILDDRVPDCDEAIVQQPSSPTLDTAAAGYGRATFDRVLGERARTPT